MTDASGRSNGVSQRDGMDGVALYSSESANDATHRNVLQQTSKPVRYDCELATMY